MRFAQVIGTVVCVQQDRALRGIKLLVLQPLTSTLVPEGSPYVAADGSHQAGYQDIVAVVFRGDAPNAFEESVPVDASIIGIVDEHSVQLLRGR